MRIDTPTQLNQLSRKKAYCLYLRKSRADLELEARGEFETLARHEAQLMEMADRMGLYIAKIYREIVSGESIQDRPQMQQMLQDIYEGKYEGVLVMEVERLARGNTTDQGRVAEAFKISSTKIITPTKTYDPNNEYDEEYFEFSLFMSPSSSHSSCPEKSTKPSVDVCRLERLLLSRKVTIWVHTDHTVTRL